MEAAVITVKSIRKLEHKTLDNAKEFFHCDNLPCHTVHRLSISKKKRHSDVTGQLSLTTVESRVNSRGYVQSTNGRSYE